MESNRYTFTPISKKFNSLCDKEAQDYLTKWSLNLQMFALSFNEPYNTCDAKNFIRFLLRVPSVRGELAWAELYDNDIFFDKISCTISSREFFDRILDPSNCIIYPNGEIRGCFENYVEGFFLTDELRQMLINHESLKYGLYNHIERNELLFKIFLHLALGGRWCQYEFNVQPYLDMAIMVYKDIVRVQKNKISKEIEIRSKCYSLKLQNGSIQDFVFILVDPVTREVLVFAHCFK